MRSYQNFALGFALLLFAAAVVRTAWIPRPIAYLMGLSGLTYLVQGWVVGSEGFSPTHSVAIVLAWVVSLVWMIWLVVVASNSVPADEGGGLPLPPTSSISRLGQTTAPEYFRRRLGALS